MRMLSSSAGLSGIWGSVEKLDAGNGLLDI